MDALTGEQIENWRRVLLLMIGPYALIAPEEEIQALRDKMQVELDTRVAMNNGDRELD